MGPYSKIGKKLLQGRFRSGLVRSSNGKESIQLKIKPWGHARPSEVGDGDLLRTKGGIWEEKSLVYKGGGGQGENYGFW